MLDVELEMREIGVAPGSVLVANHVSWLDVIVLSARLPADCPVDFVAKAEVRRWPLIGWLLARNGCLFVDRRVGRHLLRLNAEIGKRLASGRVVAFFPEGTTTNGTGLLPFRPALFEPAVRGGYRVLAIALDYRDVSGRRCEAAAFVGQQSLWQSLLTIAARPGIVASLKLCPAIASAGLSRSDAARQSQAKIQEARPDSAFIAEPEPIGRAVLVLQRGAPAPARARARC